MQRLLAVQTEKTTENKEIPTFPFEIRPLARMKIH